MCIRDRIGFGEVKENKVNKPASGHFKKAGVAPMRYLREIAMPEAKDGEQIKVGDTITVAYRIKEGNKERIQQYRGVVIRISGEGNKKRFTVRKMSDNIGVERIFPIESPFIDSIVVNKYGKVRRAKLYYLRGLTGKKARIKERRVVK